MAVIKNRFEFMLYLMCLNANPNGDPDSANAPRMDAQTGYGVISDVSFKRRIRDYTSLFKDKIPGMEIFVQSDVNLNREIAEVRESVGLTPGQVQKADIEKARQAACAKFFDVRTFGAVMNTGPNGGQVRGPVQVGFGNSLDPIFADEASITRVAVSEGDRNKSAEYYAQVEAEMPADKLHTIGSKNFVPFGLYRIYGFISANLARQTGFSEEDLMHTFEAMVNMYDSLRSSSKGLIAPVTPLIIFKHVGDPNVSEEVRARQALLGRAHAHKLFELVTCKKKPDVKYPRYYTDYDCNIGLSRVPKGIEVGFLPGFSDEITWGALPDGEKWMTAD